MKNMSSMNTYETVWAISKWRFLQSEARQWMISNKIIEIIFIGSLSIWIYFEFFSESYEFIKYIGLFFFVISILVIYSRYSKYLGYFDGYEQGFQDAATRNCDYWGATHDKHEDEQDILAVLNEISKNEENISKENMESRNDEIKKGFSKLVGFILTWKRIR